MGNPWRIKTVHLLYCCVSIWQSSCNILLFVSDTYTSMQAQGIILHRCTMPSLPHLYIFSSTQTGAYHCTYYNLSQQSQRIIPAKPPLLYIVVKMLLISCCVPSSPTVLHTTAYSLLLWCLKLHTSCSSLPTNTSCSLLCARSASLHCISHSAVVMID